MRDSEPGGGGEVFLRLYVRDLGSFLSNQQEEKWFQTREEMRGMKKRKEEERRERSKNRSEKKKGKMR